MKRFLIAMIAVLVAFPAYANEAWRMGAVQTMYFNTVSKEITTAFAKQTRHVRIVTNEDAYISFTPTNGKAAVAIPRGTTSFYVAANTPEYFVISPGTAVAVIRATTNGTISITEISK